jgi:hypothetical protein
MGRPKGAKNQADEARRFVFHVERSLKAGGYGDGLINLVCRQLADKDLCNPILMKLLDYKYGRPRGDSDEHKHLHVAMTSDAANQLIREYFGASPAGEIEVGGSHQIEETQQDR